MVILATSTPAAFCTYQHERRLYDPALGRVLSPDNYVQDPHFTQNYNRYSYAYNNPLLYNDPDGQWLHIAIGAAVGGLVNLGVKLAQGKIHNFKDGLVAFGIGAVAGGLGAATGGASLAASGLGAASIGLGALAGLTGAAIASPIQGLGNAAYFGDSYSLRQFGTDVLLGGVLGGVSGGIANLIKAGKTGIPTNIWTGKTLKDGQSIWSFRSGAGGHGGLGGNPTTEFPDYLDAKGNIQKGGKHSINASLYDEAMLGLSEEYITVFHKGNLNGGIISNTKELSVGLNKASVNAIRNGKLWEFRIPKNEFNQWKSQGLLRTLTDYDYVTGIYNQEIRFSPKLSQQLTRYIIKKQ